MSMLELIIWTVVGIVILSFGLAIVGLELEQRKDRKKYQQKLEEADDGSPFLW